MPALIPCPISFALQFPRESRGNIPGMRQRQPDVSAIVIAHDIHVPDHGDIPKEIIVEETRSQHGNADTGQLLKLLLYLVHGLYRTCAFGRMCTDAAQHHNAPNARCPDRLSICLPGVGNIFNDMLTFPSEPAVVIFILLYLYFDCK